MSQPEPATSEWIGNQSVPPDRGASGDQPRWRRDFPIDWAEDDYVTRRDLVRFIVLTSAAFAVGQLTIVIIDPCPQFSNVFSAEFGFRDDCGGDGDRRNSAGVGSGGGGVDCILIYDISTTTNV